MNRDQYTVTRWSANHPSDYDYSIDGDQTLELPEWNAEHGSVWEVR